MPGDFAAYSPWRAFGGVLLTPMPNSLLSSPRVQDAKGPLAVASDQAISRSPKACRNHARHRWSRQPTARRNQPTSDQPKEKPMKKPASGVSAPASRAPGRRTVIAARVATVATTVTIAAFGPGLALAEAKITTNHNEAQTTGRR
jgi:hypothetical protein